MASSYSADEKIGIRSLNSFFATDVKELGRLLIIVTCKLKVGKRPQVIPEIIKVGFIPDA
jgi:hypothetical protein